MRKVAAAGLVLALAAGCGGGGDDAPTPAGQAPPGGQLVQVSIRDYTFAPQSITVPAGKPVVFRITNRDKDAHTFSFSKPDGGYDVVVKGKTTKEGSPVVLQPGGKFEFFCQYHAGMAGTLAAAVDVQ